MGTIRFSTGKHTSEEEITRAANSVIEIVKKLQAPDTSQVEPLESIGEIKLTKYTHGMGCACKIRPQYLEKVLRDLPVVFDKNVLIGSNNSDDAAVYKISPKIALVQSVDFFTPIVDDPYYFGAIAAANALSDIYAMGAKPIFALNIVGFPDHRLPMQVLKDILRGASDKAAEAGISILGGHTVEDTEPKFGMVVSGVVHPDKVLANSNAKAGDILILTKSIGTGIISTAVKNGLADQTIANKARDIMATLNARAAEVMADFTVSACTDITGFGLLGHLKELVEASAVEAEIYANQIPFIEGVYELAMAGAIPGGTNNNLDFVSKIVHWPDNISEVMKLMICDAQTSGGLLIAIPEAESETLLRALRTKGVETATIIGRIRKKGVPGIFMI
jgi:selenium donor protein